MASEAYWQNYDLIDWSGIKNRQRPACDMSFVCSDFPMPLVMPDTPEYISPVTGRIVDGRVARQEDLKRAGCREVDPSEYRPTYKSKRLQKRYGKGKYEDG